MWDLNLGQWVQIFNGIVGQWKNCYREVSVINKINYVEMFKIQESCAKLTFYSILVIQQMFAESLQ